MITEFCSWDLKPCDRAYNYGCLSPGLEDIGLTDDAL